MLRATAATVPAPAAPVIAPPTAPPIHTAMNGFLYFRLTPYITGSITFPEKNDVKLRVRAFFLIFLSLAFRATAKPAVI